MSKDGAGKAQILWQDDFSDGFDHGPADTGRKWFSPVLAGYLPNDGIVSRIEGGIRVASLGAHPQSGEPAFTLTLPKEKSDGETPGELDHLKWLSFANHFSSAGVPGFDVVPDKALSFEAVLGGRTFGTGNHPFGEDVLDADADPRLAVSVMVCGDLLSGMGFDFFLTNTKIYVGYERVRFARPRLGNYAAFLYSVPVAERQPGDIHRLKISFDGQSNVVKWFVDGAEVFRVEEVGMPIDRKYMMLDKGGEPQVAKVNQLACGLGMMSLLDGAIDEKRALVNLSGALVDFAPSKGEPVRCSFVDSESHECNRLFGQGTELICNHCVILYE